MTIIMKIHRLKITQLTVASGGLQDMTRLDYFYKLAINQKIFL